MFVEASKEGFLLGELVNKETSTISDFQINGKEKATSISLHSIMPLPSRYSFYNHIGKINPSKLKEILRDKTKEVVGWYRFRRNTSLNPYLIERLVHLQLSEMLLPVETRDCFVMCILSSSKSASGSTHRFNHVFYTQRHSDFEAIPLKIENLGDTSVSGYKVVSNPACSESFENVISSLKVGPNHVSEAQQVVDMQVLLKKHLQKLVHDLASSEARKNSLQKEVDLLKSQLKTGKISNEVLLPQLLSMPVSDQPEITKTAKFPEDNHNSPSTSVVDMEEETQLRENKASSIEELPPSEKSTESMKEKSPPIPNQSSLNNDPFDFVTELKNEMTPQGVRKGGAVVVENFPPNQKGNSASGATGAKRKQSLGACPPSPTLGASTTTGGGDNTDAKTQVNKNQRPLRKGIVQENQRSTRARSGVTTRTGNNSNNSTSGN